MIPRPTFNEELGLWKSGIAHVAGCDEVGRGAFAGPVVAAAVILPERFPLMDEVHDSKLLQPRKRETLAEIIKTHALSYGIGEISVSVINRMGIGKATHFAFRKALRLLSIKPQFVLVDGFLIKHVARRKQKAIIHGDRISLSIAAASIIAKVYRDSLMRDLSKQFHKYNFAQNKGYGTRKHRSFISLYGLSPHHRTSFDLSSSVSAD